MATMVAYACNNSPHMDQTELAKIDQTVAKVFEAICFEADTPPNMSKIRPYFAESGRLIDYNNNEALNLAVDDFIDHFQQQWEQGLIPSLEDREVYHETRIYGRVAHRFSFYEARFQPHEQPFAQGVNSIQLIKVSDQWLITSMAWNDDNRGDGFFKKMVADSRK